MVSVAAGLIGIALAAWFYLIAPAIPEGAGAHLQHALPLDLQQVLRRRILRLRWWSTPWSTARGSLLWRVVDAGGIDGIVNGIGKTARNVGGILKRMQSGYIRSYAAWVVLGSIVVIVAIDHGRRRPMTLLDVVLFLPLIGFLLLLLIPKSNPGLSAWPRW